MNVQVKLFARYRDLVGERELVLEVEEGATVGLVWDRLKSRYPELAEMTASTVFAVNQEYVSVDHQLAAGDEVAFIPPVSGGSHV